LTPLANPTRSDAALLERVRAALDAGAGTLDAPTLARLRAARRAALARAGERRRWYAWPAPPRAWLLPAGGFASLAVVALTVALFTASQPGAAPHTALEDVELLSSKADLELLDDLDFYAWLQTTGGHG